MTIAAESSRLESGDAAAVSLQLAAPPGATLTLWASSGTVSAPVPAGEGRWTARYQATADRFPRVALLRAVAQVNGREERAWLALPIDGRDTLTLSTKPSSRVEVQIADAIFGPVRSDKAGRAQVAVTVPPGLHTATVRVRDAFGNNRETAFDLRPPPFRRLCLIASAASASWADAAPVALEIFAVDPAGRPARAADLLVSADRGELGAPEEKAPGVFVVPYRAPARVDAREARLEARLFGDLTAVERATVAIAPGPAARIELKPSTAHIAPGETLHVEATVLDARGNALPEPPLRFETDLGVVKPSGAGAAELAVPAAFAGREAAHLVARAGVARADLPIALVPGAPASLQIHFARKEIREGEQVEATVQVADAGGNPVVGAPLRLDALGAALDRSRELGAGRYAVRLQALPASAPGAELRVGAGPAQSSARLAVIPEERPWGVSAGGWLLAQHNLSRAASAGLELEVAAHSGARWLELFGRGVAVQFAPMRAVIDGASVQRTSLEAFGAQAGARALLPLRGGWSLHASAAAGMLRAVGTLRVQGGPADGVSEPTARWMPALSAGAGGSLRLGRGRLLAEAQVASVPSSGVVQGNLGGLWLRAGWLFNLDLR